MSRCLRSLGLAPAWAPKGLLQPSLRGVRPGLALTNSPNPACHAADRGLLLTLKSGADKKKSPGGCVEGLRGKQSLSNLFAHNCLFLSRKSLKQTCRERSAPPARSRGKRILPSARRAAESSQESSSTAVACWGDGEPPRRAGRRELCGRRRGPPRGALRRPAARRSGTCARSQGRPAEGRPGRPGPLAWGGAIICRGQKV